MADAMDGRLFGVLPALVTPFSLDGADVNVTVLRAVVDRAIASGVHGLVPCGGTGEFTSLSSAERRTIVEVVCEQAAGRVPVVPQTGAITTAEAISHSVHAQQSGASAVMVGLPYYEPLKPEQVLRYYAAVAAEIDLPIVAYNYPFATGVDLDAAYLKAIADAVPSVRYVKDSGGDFSRLAHTSVDLRGQVSTFEGIDHHAGPSLLMGAAGLINGAASVFPGEFAQLYDAHARGEAGSVIERWLRLTPFLKFLDQHPYVSTVKHACQLLGLEVGPVRPPTEELPAADLPALANLVAALSA